jgi:hypothetical protein
MHRHDHSIVTTRHSGRNISNHYLADLYAVLTTALECLRHNCWHVERTRGIMTGQQRSCELTQLQPDDAEFLPQSVCIASRCRRISS